VACRCRTKLSTHSPSRSKRFARKSLSAAQGAGLGAWLAPAQKNTLVCPSQAVTARTSAQVQPKAVCRKTVGVFAVLGFSTGRTSPFWVAATRSRSALVTLFGDERHTTSRAEPAQPSALLTVSSGHSPLLLPSRFEPAAWLPGRGRKTPSPPCALFGCSRRAGCTASG